MRVRRRLAGQDTIVAFLDLMDSICIIISNMTISNPTPIRNTGSRSPYEVTGISPQSRTVAQLLNGFAARGTLYPPLNRTFREPSRPRRQS